MSEFKKGPILPDLLNDIIAQSYGHLSGGKAASNCERQFEAEEQSNSSVLLVC